MNFDELPTLYVDGGVIGRNPSPYDGTWAWRHVAPDGSIVESRSGYCRGSSFGEKIPLPVSNNVSELVSLLRGIYALPAGWNGTICSDSQVTLGRVFQGWALSGVPAFLIPLTLNAAKRLGVFRVTLLDGHPTAAQLESGIGKRGHPVSIHNVWCDQQCSRLAKEFLDNHRKAA